MDHARLHFQNTPLERCCAPSSKNNDKLNGSLYLGSLINEYTFDDKVRLFIEINGTRHQLNLIS
jgi:hypothetical protein